MTKTDNLPVKSEQAALPELYGTAAPADIQFPELRVAAELSDVVKARIARPGDVLLMQGSDDTDPTFLICEEDGITSFNAYILARSPFAATTEGGGITFQQERDPDDPKSWSGYFYTLAIPEVDPDVPCRVMAWRTAWRPFIRKANFMIAKAIKEGMPPPHIKCTISTKVSQGGFSYSSLIPALIPADDGLEAAIAMQGLALSTKWENSSTDADEPADSDLPAI